MRDRESIEAGIRQTELHGEASALPQTLILAIHSLLRAFSAFETAKNVLARLCKRRQHRLNRDDRDQLQHMSSIWMPGSSNERYNGGGAGELRGIQVNGKYY